MDSINKERSLPHANEKTLYVLILTQLSFCLYGFYWLDKQLARLERHASKAPESHFLIKFGYLIFGILIMLYVLAEVGLINTTWAYNTMYILAIIYYGLLLYCSFHYLSILNEMQEIRLKAFSLIGVLLFHVFFLNWRQNKGSYDN